MLTPYSTHEIKHQFEQLTQHLPMPTALFDREMRYLFASASWYREFDLDESILGQPHYDIFPEIEENWKQIHQECLLGRIHRDDEVPFQRLDGTIEWLWREIRPWYALDGEIGGIIMYVEVLTERKHTQEALKEQHRFLRQVIDLNTSFIFAKDTMGQFTLVNKALADHYGSTPDEMVGKIDEDFNPRASETAHFRRDDLEVIHTRTPKFIPEEPVSKVATGEMRWYQTVKVPLINENGQDVQLLGIATDVTERKRAEETLQQLVIQEQKSRKAAEEASRMKDLFMANMSHELRTPLNAIIGFLREMLYSKQLDDDNTHLAERSLANGKRLQMLITSVLDLSRIAVGSLELVVADVDLFTLAKDVIEDLIPQAQAKALELSLDIATDLPRVIQHDEERLIQIISNLVVNAIKYTHEGRVKLALRPSVNHQLLIEVSDTGIGIPDHMQSYIFEDFTQLDKRSQNQGAGIGLSIVRKLIELMEGTISIESVVGSYTIFTVEVPMNLRKLGKEGNSFDG
jgi:PAS domain S-box-containing protein